MTRRADRLFRIVRQLQIHGQRTAEQLADTLEVSVRTIYRDMDALSASDVPIQAIVGEGYSLMAGWRLPAMQFTLEELEAVITGLRMVKTFGDDSLANDAMRVHERMLDALPEALRASSHEVNLHVPDFYVPSEASQWLSTVRHAIRDHHWLNMTYHDAEGKPSARRIEPLGMFFWGKHWTLGAWCLLRQDFRHFRLERIQTLTVDQAIATDQRHTLSAFLDSVRNKK